LFLRIATAAQKACAAKATSIAQTHHSESASLKRGHGLTPKMEFCARRLVAVARRLNINWISGQVA